MARDSHLKKVLGVEKLGKIKKSKVLLVGSGGIGCELLKNLILTNYGEIHIVDLDTIDLSNLNRQFLFRQKDIKKSKSSTAIKAVEFFNNDKNTILKSYHGSIMDTIMFPLEWFDQFDIIFNALDNLEARNYVNKIALFLKRPLMESGTTGFKGQVQPIFPYKSECFDCIAKETPKTFPVCTIRSTPSKPIHSITWAKNFLFLQLFGEDVKEDLNPNDLDTDDKQEIDALLRENNELWELKALIKESKQDNIDYIYKIINKIFNVDIQRLLSIDSLWTIRTKPKPLDYENYKIDLNVQDDDQKLWNVEENLSILIKSIKSLSKRYVLNNFEAIPFDKDDKDTLNFVVASSNLRSFIFNIPTKTKFDIKQIAGNIIPAVATTNAIIAGFSCLQSLNCFENSLQSSFDKSRLIFTSQYFDKFVSSSALVSGNKNCKECSIKRGILKIKNGLDTFILQDLIDKIREVLKYEEVSLILGKNKLIYDFDFDDNLSVRLVDIGFKNGEVLSINDEDDEKESCELYIEVTSDNGDKVLEVPSLDIPDKEKKEVEEEEEQEEEEAEAEIDKGDDGFIVDDDGIVILDIDDDSEEAATGNNKRRAEDENIGETPQKKKKFNDSIVSDQSGEEHNENIVVID
ncbi:hypothetical protein PACTADRAFT_33346 [Pachysolen tannophilus NRRL Y-2460]|uniref:Ubiquitin-activating enzyme E1-like n=1 Tax=Pachysolen tannophilus NRRL Y-2460 TaxID=669874 RepID=A0A1E4TWN3_PACTA|nr:hypothetical protein PACTADRAFT_33346 [Pachysolen tannophilus NRRL Y-2460]